MTLACHYLARTFECQYPYVPVPEAQIGPVVVHSLAEAVIQCPIRTVPIMIKDMAAFRKQKLQRALSLKRKQRQRGAPKLKPKKKSKKSQDHAGKYTMWPVILPHELFQRFIESGNSYQVHLAMCWLPLL